MKKRNSTKFGVMKYSKQKNSYDIRTAQKESVHLVKICEEEAFQEVVFW